MFHPKGYYTSQGYTGFLPGGGRMAFPTQDEYLELLMQADPAFRQIEKTRYCLTYESQYFEIDFFPCWSDQAMVEIELVSEQMPVTFPPQLEVIREVTGDPTYRNAVIASKPRGATH